MTWLMQLRAASRFDTERTFGLRRVLAFTLAFSIPLLFVSRMLSSDIYSYISYRRMAALHHVNPFLQGPQVNGDVFVEHIEFEPFRYVGSAYGPT